MTRKTPPDLYEEIVRIRRSGGRAALATIIRRVGSAPRKDAAKMLILEDGSYVGSVGGGCVEAEVWQAAQTAMESGQPSIVKYQLNDDDAEADGLICGGTVEIFVEPIVSEPELFVMGAGHLGRAISEMASQVGFRVTVIDDRESFANPERLTSAHRVLVRPFSESLDALGVTRDSFILVVTRGHKHDQTVLETSIRTPARYVGMVGSRRKIGIIVQNILAKGYSVESFQHLYAPIGLDIGSETPEEIAVSVVAEIIAVRRGVHKRSSKQTFVLKLIEKKIPKES